MATTEQADDLGAYTADQFRERMGGMGRTTFYRLVRAGKLKTVKLGDRTLVLRRDARAFQDSLNSQPSIVGNPDNV